MIIDDLLRDAKMSQYKLSKESGVAQATISDICSRKTTMKNVLLEPYTELQKH